MKFSVTSIYNLKDELHTFHESTCSNLNPEILEKFDVIMCKKFDAGRAAILSNQYRELVGSLFPVGSRYFWEGVLVSDCVYVDDGLLTFNVGLIKIETIYDDLRCCARTFYDYAVARDSCELCVDLRDLTWSKTFQILQNVTSSQMRIGMLIFHTIPVGVKRVVVHKPNMFGINTLIRAALSVASKKIQSRVVFV